MPRVDPDVTIEHHFGRLSLCFDVYFAVIAFSNHFLCLSITTTIDGCYLAVVIAAAHYLRTSTDVRVDSSLAFRFYRYIPL